jgi:hypothetical protein
MMINRVETDLKRFIEQYGKIKNNFANDLVFIERNVAIFFWIFFIIGITISKNKAPAILTANVNEHGNLSRQILVNLLNGIIFDE